MRFPSVAARVVGALLLLFAVPAQPAEPLAPATIPTTLPASCPATYAATAAVFRDPSHASMEGWLITEATMTERGAGLLTAVQKAFLSDRLGNTRYWYLQRATLRLAPAAAGCAVTIRVQPPSTIAPYPRDLSDAEVASSGKLLALRITARFIADDLQRRLALHPSAADASPLLLSTALDGALQAVTDALQMEGFWIDRHERTTQDGRFTAVQMDHVMRAPGS